MTAMESITLKKLKEKFPDSIVDTHSFRGDETATVKKEKIIEICKFLRDDNELLYNFMMDLTAVDYYGREPRFEVVYHLYSLKYNMRGRIKVPVPESDCTTDSIISLWF